MEVVLKGLEGVGFEHHCGVRLEVKQSARKQTWAPPASSRSQQFDIAPHKGFWDGSIWTAHRGRNADIYVFAVHDIVDETADHRDPGQWMFHVVPTSRLPDTKTIALPRLRALVTALPWDQLYDAVEQERVLLPTRSLT